MKWRIAFVLLLFVACPALADGQGVAHIPLPANLTGTLDGVAYKIRVPANWNGTLLVFAHGDQTTLPTAELSPVAYPAATPSLEEQLLALGYALAGSGYPNAEKDGVIGTVALATYFRDAVGNPRRTIVWGNSLGSIISLKLIEKYPGIFDGTVANCAPAVGTAMNMDSALAFALAYKAVFGWHDDLWGPISDVRSGLIAMADVVPAMVADGALPAPPSPPFLVLPGTPRYGKWEFIRVVMHLEKDAFWGKDPTIGFPFFAMQIWKSTERRSVVEEANGGAVAQNFGAHYWIDPADAAMLSNSYGVNAEPLLAFMNANANISADVVARKHADHWGGFSGELKRPVLNMHATLDGVALTSAESYYAALVNTAGCSDRLVQTFVDTIGHCKFTADQYRSALAAMVSWLDTGTKPDASAFPASQGFKAGYLPSAWVF